jgi:hypothetical protein
MVPADKTFPMRPEEQGMTRGVAKESFYLSLERFHAHLLPACWLSWRQELCALAKNFCRRSGKLRLCE